MNKQMCDFLWEWLMWVLVVLPTFTNIYLTFGQDIECLAPSFLIYKMEMITETSQVYVKD